MRGDSIWALVAMVAFGLTTGVVGAHDDAAIARLKAPHGGQQKVAGPFHLELVMARDGGVGGDRPVLVYVTDHDGKPIATTGGSGSATLLSGRNRSSVTLAPDGGNRLKGGARYPSSADLKVTVSVTLPGKPVEQARFTPFEAAGR
jgi:hypothetical protein